MTSRSLTLSSVPLFAAGLLSLVLLQAGIVTSAAPRLAAGPDPANIKVRLDPFVQGLENPVAFAAPEDGSGRLFVVEKAGRIKIIQNGQVQGRLFLDITERVESAANERGLLGLAFHPDYAQNGTFVVGYTAKSPMGQVTYSSFQVSADPGRANQNSEKRIIAWPHARGNHNGGDVQFGPDGYLYLGTGDGGGGGDPDRNGQDGQTLLGKMLRLDIDTDKPYEVPADNPFVGDARFRDEIWALGLRNPWRYTFDSDTGDLYIADVGQGRWEEVDFQAAGDPGGQNYGWNIMEGAHCYNSATCNQDGLTLPVMELSHGDGHCSITGGYVYRGRAYPNLVGLFFFADYCSNILFAASRDESGAWRFAEVGRQANMRIQSFGQDADGELYVLGGNGRIMRLTDNSGTIPPTPTPTDAPTVVATDTTTPEDTATPTLSATATTSPATETPATGVSPTATNTLHPLPSLTPTPSGEPTLPAAYLPLVQR